MGSDCGWAGMSFLTKDVEYLFVCPSAISVFSLVEYFQHLLFISQLECNCLSGFWIWLFVLLLDCRSSLYFLSTFLGHIYVIKTFPPCCDLLLIFYQCLWRTEFSFISIKSNLLILNCIAHTFWVIFKKCLQNPSSLRFHPMWFFRSFIIPALPGKVMIHFQFIFIWWEKTARFFFPPKCIIIGKIIELNSSAAL